MTNTILILIGGHLSTAPRPLKEARILAEAGFKVTVAGCSNSFILASRDRELSSSIPFTYVRYADISASSPVNRFINRAKRWLALRYGVFPGSNFGYTAKEMLRFALDQKADLTIVHSEAGLWVASKLLNKNYKTGVDFEDWFSEQPGVADNPRILKKLKSLESEILSHAIYRLTTSSAMSQALYLSYGLSEQPAVAYNVFPAGCSSKETEFVDRVNRAIPSLFWFSQAIGWGRGLELLMDSLYHLDKTVEIHLRGDDILGIKETLLDRAPARHKPYIHFHPSVSMDELEARIPEHDIGLALEIPNCPNHDLTVSNKLFQYLSFGLLVIATRTKGQEEAAKFYPDRIRLLDENTPFELARAIKSALKVNRQDSGSSEKQDCAEKTSYQALKNTILEEVGKALA